EAIERFCKQMRSAMFIWPKPSSVLKDAARLRKYPFQKRISGYLKIAVVVLLFGLANFVSFVRAIQNQDHFQNIIAAGIMTFVVFGGLVMFFVLLGRIKEYR